MGYIIPFSNADRQVILACFLCPCRVDRALGQRARIRREPAARDETSITAISRYIFPHPVHSDPYRLPPPRNPHIAIDLLELLRILRMYRDQNIGIDRFNRILEVAFAGVA